MVRIGAARLFISIYAVTEFSDDELRSTVENWIQSGDYFQHGANGLFSF